MSFSPLCNIYCMLHNNVLLEAYPANRICGCIVELKPKLSPLWYICTLLARCIQTQAHNWNTFLFMPYKNDTVNGWILHKSGACHFFIFFCHDIKELTHLTCAWGGGSHCGHAVSLLCHTDAWNLIYVPSLQTLHHTFTCRSHQPIHAEERKRPPCQGSLIPSPSCFAPLYYFLLFLSGFILLCLLYVAHTHAYTRTHLLCTPVTVGTHYAVGPRGLNAQKGPSVAVPLSRGPWCHSEITFISQTHTYTLGSARPLPRSLFFSSAWWMKLHGCAVQSLSSAKKRGLLCKISWFTID